MSDDSEVLVLTCDKCISSRQGTYEQLFGDLPSLRLLPPLKCKCGGDIILEIKEIDKC